MKQEFAIRYRIDLFFSGALAVSAAGRALDFLIFPGPPTEYVRRLGSTQLWGAMFATAAVLIVAGILRELWLLRIGPPAIYPLLYAHAFAAAVYIGYCVAVADVGAEDFLPDPVGVRYLVIPLAAAALHLARWAEARFDINWRRNGGNLMDGDWDVYRDAHRLGVKLRTGRSGRMVLDHTAHPRTTAAGAPRVPGGRPDEPPRRSDPGTETGDPEGGPEVGGTVPDTGEQGRGEGSPDRPTDGTP